MAKLPEPTVKIIFDLQRQLLQRIDDAYRLRKAKLGLHQKVAK